jgi:hypothetical protein
MPSYLIRNKRDRDRLGARQLDAWDRAGDALATARRREDRSLARAARDEGTTVATIRKYYGPAVTRKGERGWWRATEWDRAYRGEIHLLTESGDVLVEARDSRSRALASAYAHAIDDYRHQRDPDGEGLRRFRGRRIGGHRLLDDRDLDLIDELGRRGDPEWPDLYERVS